jgi:hypothetical protein
MHMPPNNGFNMAKLVYDLPKVSRITHDLIIKPFAFHRHRVMMQTHHHMAIFALL